MQYKEGTPFYRLLATRFDADREVEAIEILKRHPDIVVPPKEKRNLRGRF
jgi:hypothetical protein